MAILAENNGSNYEPMASGNYVARCYSMIEVGTVTDEFEGKKKVSKKVRLSFEFPTEQKVFKEENGMQPFVLSKTYTLSMHEKASLRKDLESWRGKSFTEEEAKSFDITVLIGKTCMINVIHKESRSGGLKAYISTISTMPKGLECPKQILDSQVLSYDNFNRDLFEKMPDFVKDEMKSTPEYKALFNMTEKEAGFVDGNSDNLPF